MRKENRMESEMIHSVDKRPFIGAVAAEPADPTATGVRRWLEDAWRHGEIVDDDDWVETIEPARQPNRFDVSHRAGEAADQDRV